MSDLTGLENVRDDAVPIIFYDAHERVLSPSEFYNIKCMKTEHFFISLHL